MCGYEMPYSQSTPGRVGRAGCRHMQMLDAGVGVPSGISLQKLRQLGWRALCLLAGIRAAGWHLKGQSDQCAF